jgi:acyl CoA:acetate/3-ketoacid CoA transferase alpha subunit
MAYGVIVVEKLSHSGILLITMQRMIRDSLSSSSRTSITENEFWRKFFDAQIKIALVSQTTASDGRAVGGGVQRDRWRELLL